ncbi:hypothetical protein F2Q69_00004639 [Brassica cretica]|uniref:Uncharacterized protein n=1 Tax=Brassica cretica TaxID=69181 RepID=A0A8S9PC55_BRACR|nr:hypothetical protein F2Q69_00004639 [Brassica cretica]
MVSLLVLKFGVHWLHFPVCLSFGFSLCFILVRGISPCFLFYGGFYLGVYWSCHLLLSDFAAFRGVMKISRFGSGCMNMLVQDDTTIRYSLALQVYTTPAQHLDSTWSSPLTTTYASATTSATTSGQTSSEYFDYKC